MKEDHPFLFVYIPGINQFWQENTMESVDNNKKPG